MRQAYLVRIGVRLQKEALLFTDERGKPRSSAARVKLKCRAEASKALRDCNPGMWRNMADLQIILED